MRIIKQTATTIIWKWRIFSSSGPFSLALSLSLSLSLLVECPGRNSFCLLRKLAKGKIRQKIALLILWNTSGAFFSFIINKFYDLLKHDDDDGENIHWRPSMNLEKNDDDGGMDIIIIIVKHENENEQPKHPKMNIIFANLSLAKNNSITYFGLSCSCQRSTQHRFLPRIFIFHWKIIIKWMNEKK